MILGSVSAQTIRYVKPQSSGNGSGTSWGNASSNLQSMITNSAAGDQVWVAAGTYKPGDQYSNRTATFTLKSGVKVYGSFAGNETSVQQRNITANPTILSGDLTGNDVPSSNPMLLSGNTTMSTNAYHVVTAGGLNKNSVFDGFTITGGYANDTGTTANGYGGGIYLSASEGTFSNLVIKNCYAFFGGGIFLSINDGITPRFDGIWISECSAGTNGANDGSAVYKQFNSGSPEFFNMVVTNCAADTAVYATNATITNSTFYNVYTGSTLNNPYKAVVYGANMYNCIIGQHSLSYAVYNVSNKYLENNSFYGLVQSGSETWYRKENITNNGNAGFVNAANGNFRLIEDSPCIGTGNSEKLNLYSSITKGYTPITTDITGKAREIGTVDMGAYEYGQLSKRYVKQTASGTGDGSSWENASGDLQLMINQSVAGDQIWVAKGTYKPVRQPNSTDITPNNRDNTFFLKSGVKIYGSFAGGETTINGRNFQANATILSGDFSNNDPDNTTAAGVLASSSLINENAYHVVVGVEVRDIIFDGFVIKGGIANGTGVIAFGDAWNPRDVARNFGGGMYLIHAQGEFNNIAVRGSLATSGGGGIFTDNAPVYLPRFNGLIITGCIGGASGAGNGSAFYADGYGGSSISGVEIFNMLVTNCVGLSSVYVTTTNAVAYITNATFYGVSVNDANAVNAGVIETASGGSVVFNNSIIGLHAYPYAFNIGWGSNITSYSSNSSIYKTKRGQGTFTATSNTTNTGNPGFISASTGDFGLTSGSAVRNLGNVAFLTTTLGSQYQYPAISKDIIGNPRLFQGGLDLGAYQYKPACEIPDAPTVSDLTLCNGSTVANLTANGTGLKWYYNATGGSALSSSTTLSTRGYFVSQTTGVCESDRVEVNVTIPAPPAAPSIGEQILCGPSTVAKLIALYPNYRWYSSSTGSNQLASTATLTHNNYYYASQVNAAGCESTSRTGFYVRVGTIPATPTANAIQLFCGTARVSDLQSSATTPRWFTAASGGFALSSSTAISTGTYYVAQMGTYCESPRIAVEVTVTPVPSAPLASAQTFCGSGIVDNLVATGENLVWYDSSFNPVSGNTLLNNGTYYVTQTVNTCPSAAKAVTVTIAPIPAAPAAYDQTVCFGSTVASLTSSGTNLKWYANAAGGSVLTADTVLSSGTYYVTQTSAAGCESPRAASVVTVSPLPPAPAAPALQTFCGTATVADLESGAPETRWYTSLTGGTSLPHNTALTTGVYYGSQMNMMCESERTAVEVVINPIPAAPVSNAQTFCGMVTAGNIIATGNNLKWYISATGQTTLAVDDLLATGTYYVSQTINNCESARTAVAITVSTLPVAPTATAQVFCGLATVGNLVANGDNLKWYASENGGDELSSATSLTTGTYYVSQNNTVCESSRTAVDVIVRSLPVAPAASAQTFCGMATVANLAANGDNLKWYASETGGDELSANEVLATGTYYVSQTNTICESARTAVQVTVSLLPEAPEAPAQTFCGAATVGSLIATGINLKWYAAENGGDELASGTTLTTGTYYVSQNNTICESPRTAVAVTVLARPAAPVAQPQTFCGSATVANIIATGSNLKWYVFETGQEELSANDELTTGTYYVSQSINGCESARAAVAITVNVLPDAPVASAQTFCGAATVGNLVATGYNLKWYSAEFGGNVLASGTVLTTGTYYVSQNNVNCESNRTAVQVVINPKPEAPVATKQVFCGEHTVASLAANGANIKWYAAETGVTALTSGTVLSTGTYYVSQTVNGCESARTGVSVIIDIIPVQPVAFAQTFCAGATVGSLVATGSHVKWYAVATGGDELALNTLLATGLYYVSDSNAYCESQLTEVQVVVNALPAAPEASVQTFCGAPTVANLTATGVNLKWYATSAGGQVLASSALINNGTYYVSQTLNECEGPRTAVQVVVAEILSAPVAPAAQAHCTTATVAELTATGMNLKWYSQAEGGSAISATELLTAGTYYVSQTAGICESPRTAVTVTLFTGCTGLESNYCNITVPRFGTALYATAVPGATSYRFRAVSGNSVQVVETAARYFALANLAQYNYDTTYSVSVSVFKDGEWSPYGPACNVSTMPVPSTSQLRTEFCGQVLQSLNNAVYAESLPLATGYRFRINNSGSIQVIEKTMNYFMVNEIIGNTYNKTYTVDVSVRINGQWSDYGSSCAITTPAPATQLANGYCGAVMPSVLSVVYANSVSQATAYRFRINDNGAIQVIEKPSGYFMVNEIAGYTYNKTYNVEVAVKVNDQWGNYGDICTLSTPVAITQLANGYCGAVMASIKSVVYANNVSQATAYRFRIVSGDNTYIITNTARYFILSSIPGNTYGKTYTVDVAVQTGSNWGPYGTTCTVSTPNAPVNRQSNVSSEETVSQVTQPITLTSYPNPYTDAFTIDMNTHSAEKVTVRTFDMNGRLVEDITLSPEELSSQKMGGRYAQGVYNVIVSQGDYIRSFKIIKK